MGWGNIDDMVSQQKRLGSYRPHGTTAGLNRIIFIFSSSLLAKPWLQLQFLFDPVDNGYVACPPLKKFLPAPLFISMNE